MNVLGQAPAHTARGPWEGVRGWTSLHTHYTPGPFLYNLRFVLLICEEETDSEGEEFLWGHTARKLSAPDLCEWKGGPLNADAHRNWF